MARQHQRLPIALVCAIDVLVVIVFATMGRLSHDLDLFRDGGVLATAWPFLVSLLVALAITRVWKAPLQLWPHAIVLWLITVGGGLALRVASGETAELPFIIVAVLVLALGLIGWRIVARVIIRLRDTRRTK